MLSVREWLTNELRVSGRTAFDFFTECYGKVYTHACRSNQIVLDTNRYDKPPHLIPIYVHSVYDRLVQQTRRIPHQAVPGEGYHKFQVTDHFVLTDPEPASMLVARKSRDGVWRC